MKKYLFSFFAIAIAIGSVAFTPRTVVTFEYDNVGLITDAGSWSSNSPTCNTGNILCTITFDDTHAGYGLASGKPNSTVLGLVNSYSAGTAHGQDIQDLSKPSGQQDTDINVQKKH